MHKKASIHDVAERAGVSIKTVSRVLNREPNVSQATRTRVMSAVEDLSYRPNLFARGLASVRSFLIGLLYDNPSASYVAGLQFGALGRCRNEGYHLIVEVLDSKDPNLSKAVQALVTESVLHGVILTPPLSDSPAVLDALREAGTRFVRIAPARHIADAPEVSIDDRQAAHDMTAYLIGLGHRRIGFIKGHPDHGASHARFEGYCSALKEAGISFDESYCMQGFFSYQSGMEAAEQLLSLPQRPTAIFASNDDMAAAVLAVAQKFDLKVPGDLSVAGFDDSLVSQVVWPRLTTCRQPISDMAAAAVSMLIQRPADGALTIRRLDHELVIRESTAPPPTA
ncbi:MAG TPA: LacI family DNA-binding transcriptional regulator [Caulobacterales bacterium]|nr:LacI family DNA-binding transcriptional regulator [Caulobacterales bacterium]